MAKERTQNTNAERKTWPSARRGRHSAYTPELGRELCEHVAEGNSAISWCRKHKLRPSLITNWAEKSPEFEGNLARARRLHYDIIADDCISIADEPMATNEEVQRARLRIDTRLKLIAKWDPQRYGDRLIEDKEVRVTVTVNDPTAAARAIIEGEVTHAIEARQITQDDQ